jgi:mono/diheme cytochrome c family protein
MTISYNRTPLRATNRSITAVAFVAAAFAFSAHAQSGDVKKGEVIFAAGNCTSCHTDVKNKGTLLAGGRALETPFGVFFGPNITPDPVHGIGRWSDADFIRAMRQGTSPKGEPYFPVFPYPAFTGLADQDLRDLKAYIFTLAPIAQPNKTHQVPFPFNLRLGAWVWKMIYFRPGPLAPDPARDAPWNRGRYLVEAAGHCAECHTQRDRLGGLKREMWLAGSRDGAEGKPAPNITPDPQTGIGGWKDTDLLYFLETGEMPDGDVVGGLMGEVVRFGTGRLSPDDRRAMVAYLKSLPPIVNKIAKKK